MICQGGGSVASGESQDARILSIDVGSSSVRAELYDDSGDNIEGTEVKLDYEFEYTADGGATQDADELFELVVQAVDGALSEAGDAEISGVAMSTFWHSVLGLDAEGRPTTPLLTWADRRAAGTVPALLERIDERAYHRRTGCVPHSSYWPAKLLWSDSAMPEAFEKTARWVSPADYFHVRFFGEPYRVGTSMASGTGLLDQNRRLWHGERPACAHGRYERCDAGAVEGPVRRHTRRSLVLQVRRGEVCHGRRGLRRGKPDRMAPKHPASARLGGDRKTAFRNGAGFARPHVLAAARRGAGAGMGRPGQRHRVRTRDEQQASRDPARRHGGRGLQVRHYRGDYRDRFPRRESSRRQRRRPPPLADVDQDHGRHSRQTRHADRGQGGLQQRRRPHRPGSARRTRDRGRKSPPRRDLRARSG